MDISDKHAARHDQCVSPSKYFVVELDQLKRILDVDGIKDRNVVAVSITGAMRYGKNFLFNFFIKYLYAQYKMRDMTEWMGNNIIRGFHWQSEQMRKTVGIWMWSDIFTHDFANGDQVVIILLGTQGMLDDESGLKASSSVFALSMMLSSVQCYNIMLNIHENNLQHLQFVTEYGILASKCSGGKAFQKLIFLVRDWPNPLKTSYGYHDEKVVDEVLAANADQTGEMRSRIAESFDEIGVSLMPHPGITVLEGHGFAVDLPDIEPEFLVCVRQLSHQLFAPENLTIKRINGETVRAGDFVKYFQSYVAVFKSKNLPELDTLYMTTVEVMDSVLSNKCMKFYTAAMAKRAAVKEPYTAEELLTMHKIFKIRATKMFQESAQLGGEVRLARLIEAIEREFLSFNEQNEHRLRMKVVKWTILVAVVLGGLIGTAFDGFGTLVGSWLGGFAALYLLQGK